jgi:hypothetical protein
VGPCRLGDGFDRQRSGGFRLRRSRADAPGSDDARGGRATPAYLYATAGRYSEPYGYRVAHACRYAAGNPNGDAFPYAFFAQPDAHADGHSNADTYSDADAGPHTYTNFTSDAL